MWQINRQAEYGLRAMLALAEQPVGNRLATKDVASHQEIPESYLAKIVGRLSQAELIHTYRGSEGGIALARQADHISILDILLALEGNISLNTCSRDPVQCERYSECVACPLWVGLQNTIEEYLASISLSDLIHSSEQCIK